LALQAYEERTKGQRESLHSCNPLFISKPTTIGHWLKNLMKEAGIDTLVLQHTRHGELPHPKHRQWEYPWQKY